MLISTKVTALLLLWATLGFAACASLGGGSAQAKRQPRVEVSDFGRTQSGAPAERYTLDAGGALKVELTNYGAGVVAIHAPDRAGDYADLVLGFDDVRGYQSSANQYFGCTTGRVANRIREGRFQLNGNSYQLEVNNPPNHLHGGSSGLHTVLWLASPSTTADAAQVRFETFSPAGAGGYPGNLALVVTYTLNREDELRIDYEARTDAATPLNLTNHCYFNLAGAGSASVLEHELQIAAQRYTPVDATLIPDGRLEPLAGTVLDFRQPLAIGGRIAALDEEPTLGYDHNYVLEQALPLATDGPGPALAFACKLRDPASGRSLEIYTSEIGLQFYSGNFLFGQMGKAGQTYPYRSALCLEPQHFPDSVNQPHFPTTILEPGQVRRSTALYRFRAH